MATDLKQIFDMIHNVLGEIHVTNNRVSGYVNQVEAFSVLFPFVIKIDANYASSLIKKELKARVGRSQGKELINRCLDDNGLERIEEHLFALFFDTAKYISIPNDIKRAACCFLFTKKSDAVISDDNLNRANYIPDNKNIKEKHNELLKNLVKNLRHKNYQDIYNEYDINAASITVENAVHILSVLVADQVSQFSIEKIVNDNEKNEIEEAKIKLKEKIHIFARKMNFKYIPDDFVVFDDLEARDGKDKTRFKRISEFFITPDIKFDNNQAAFKYLIKGFSGVGKTTLLRAINNIFVLENVDPDLLTQGFKNETQWYSDLKKSLFDNKEKTYFPVFIEAAKANEKSEEFELLDLAEKKGSIEKMIDKNELLFLIDGIDEVEIGKRLENFEKAFSDFFQKHKKINVIITSRYTGFISSVRSYEEKILGKLAYTSIEHYINNSKIIEKDLRNPLIKFINKSEDIKDLVSTPFYFEKLVSMFSTNPDLSVYEYLKNSIDSIIKVRWENDTSVLKDLLALIAKKVDDGDTISHAKFSGIINLDTLPNWIKTSLSNDKAEKEYDNFIEQWNTKSGILSFKNENSERVICFDNKLTMSYLASLYVVSWFDNNYGSIKPHRARRNIDCFYYIHVLEAMNKEFTLSNNLLRTFLFVLSNGKATEQTVLDNLILSYIVLKYASTDQETRNNIESSFRRLKNSEFGSNLISNPSSNPSGLKTIIEKIIQ